MTIWLRDLPEEMDRRYCFLGGGGGSQQPSGSTTTVQKSDPWEGQQPFLKTGFEQAQNLYNQGGPQYYGGQTYAGMTDPQNQAIQAQIAQASGSNPLTDAATGSAINRFDPNYLTSNPGNAMYSALGNGDAMQGAVNSAVQRAAPGLLDSFTQGNRMNSPGAAFAISQGLGDAAAPYVFQGQQAAAQGISSNYNTAGQQQNQAMLMAPQLQQMPYSDISQLYGAGAAQQGEQQAQINDQMAKYNYEQTQPYNLLDWYNGAVGGSYGGTSTLTSPYFSQPSNPLGGALGGAALGGGLGYMMGMPWAGAAAGGLLGGLFS